MFLRCKKRHKDGKEHLYWSIVENRRVSGGRILQRHVLYLGELNGRQEASWQKTIDLFAREGDPSPQQVSLFPEEHLPLDTGHREIPALGIRLSGMKLLKPRQWGACWLGCQLWEQLGLDGFWAERLPVGRQGARWADILKTIAIYRLVSPGSEWRLHRHWFEHSAMADLLGGDFSLAEIRPIHHQLEHRIESHQDVNRQDLTPPTHPRELGQGSRCFPETIRRRCVNVGTVRTPRSDGYAKIQPVYRPVLYSPLTEH